MKVREMKVTKMLFWTTKATMKKITMRNARFAHGGATVGEQNFIDGLTKIKIVDEIDFICPMCKKKASEKN